jgi:hypothetical protein
METYSPSSVTESTPERIQPEEIIAAYPCLCFEASAREQLQEICEVFSGPSIDQFFDKLKRLNCNGTADHPLHLERDSAAYSFYFSQRNAHGQVVLNGGLIWHGNPEDGFLDAMSWSIHT